MMIYKVTGDSMEPIFKEGDVVIVGNTKYADNDIVIAYIEKENKYIIKRIKGDYLIGDNLKHSTVYKINEVKILGQAKLINADKVMAGDDISLKGMNDKNNYFKSLI